MGFSSNPSYSSHYLAPYLRDEAIRRGKKSWYGCNRVELSLITRVLISRAHLVAANSRIITEGDQFRFHPRKNTPFPLLDVQKVGIKYVLRVEKMQRRYWIKMCVCISHYVYLLGVGTEYLFCIYTYRGKKYERIEYWVSMITRFFFFRIYYIKKDVYVLKKKSWPNIFFIFYR